ncbi:MAG TPA: transposase [Nitrososphaeraceae archaeon]|nr:transposase [Nitrososphaeraceae archaeon]
MEWNEIELLLPSVKPNNTIGVLFFHLERFWMEFYMKTYCRWKILPREYGSGSTCHRRFQEWMDSI